MSRRVSDEQALAWRSQYPSDHAIAAACADLLEERALSEDRRKVLVAARVCVENCSLIHDGNGAGLSPRDTALIVRINDLGYNATAEVAS
jgi:hypothetical protein